MEVSLEKRYKSRLYRILLLLVYGAVATVVVGLIVYNFFGEKYAIGASILFALLYLWLAIIDCYIQIVVKDGKLIVIKGKKRREFVIDECSFTARTTTSSGETSCHLSIVDAQGEKHDVDCELIGIGQFNHLLEDLRIIGEKAETQKLETKRRTE